jgi:hypothetical protein
MDSDCEEGAARFVTVLSRCCLQTGFVLTLISGLYCINLYAKSWHNHTEYFVLSMLSSFNETA